MGTLLKWRIFRHFLSRNHYGFTFYEVCDAFPEQKTTLLARSLAEMVQIGMLYHLGRNKYFLIPPEVDHETFEPGPLLVAKYLMRDKDYYIGYLSALRVLGIDLGQEVGGGRSTDKHHLVQVVVKKQVKPFARKILGVDYQFIRSTEDCFFGFDETYVFRMERAMLSDLEKVVVDMASKPQHAGGLLPLGKLIYLAVERINQDKLLHYFTRNLNKSAKKRYLFLVDLLGLEWSLGHERMMNFLGTGSSLLDPTFPDQGPKQSMFGLRINRNPAELRQEIVKGI